MNFLDYFMMQKCMNTLWLYIYVFLFFKKKLMINGNATLVFFCNKRSQLIKILIFHVKA